MPEPLDTDRLVFGGSLYPPPDVPRLSPRRALLVIVLLAVAAWTVVLLMVYPVLMR